MTTNFTLSTAFTVANNYSWDQGIPLTGTNITVIPVDITTTSLTGYAPGIRVIFKNNSITDSGYSNIQFIWDFGDYYNTATNLLTLSCPATVEHTYLMPGEYTVTLYHIQSRIRQDFDFSGNNTYCKGKYDIRWFWDNMLQLSATWDQTKCDGLYAKWWDNEVDCFAKYCKFWNWYDLQSLNLSGKNPVTWEQTYETGGLYPKKWAFEANDTICKANQDVTFVNTVESLAQVYTTTAVVKVLEIPPVVNLYCLTQPITGITPFTVQLTPRGTVPGSFAIDKIVWDLGDGTSTKTVWRHNTPDVNYFTYTGIFSADPQDPRNYDLTYTYKRNFNNYPVFYPSITAFCGNTNTSDACSITLGPIALSSASGQIHLLKSHNFSKDSLYALQFNNKATFVTTQTAESLNALTPNVPTNTLKNTSLPTINYYGNTGLNYPPIYNVQC